MQRVHSKDPPQGWTNDQREVQEVDVDRRLRAAADRGVRQQDVLPARRQAAVSSRTVPRDKGTEGESGGRTQSTAGRVCQWQGVCRAVTSRREREACRIPAVRRRQMRRRCGRHEGVEWSRTRTIPLRTHPTPVDRGAQVARGGAPWPIASACARAKRLRTSEEPKQNKGCTPLQKNTVQIPRG